ncbi:hypothetical protein [Caminibacter pacificus]|jgi:hypothetical protein|uniref:Motility integral membrane protein n=1 Tax=Caminibacter pacificus TaxID=1424653 RepID=A0AAJ4RDL6_9BACT|nr:hypothetical protein [Caminibacter pacificus]NPA87225.1 hypothetical protein [Campylobacterota bacterium]QCI28684.1 hypothetical protein C6V80_06795 [Caminibacter pacificus]ROR40585.1 hypothetical protein EDC58_0064 [Caminibacter pacificus]
MRGENFIYFATVSGFFIGLIFSVLKDFGVEELLLYTFLITLIFYLVALASVAFYVKYIDIKQIEYLNKKEIDSVLDVQIKELEKKEDSILNNYEFIKKVEEEELEIIRKNKS